MKLTIDREDLKPEHRDVNCSLLKFDHFLPEVQNAVRVVGQATFREYSGNSYSVIRPHPEEVNAAGS